MLAKRIPTNLIHDVFEFARGVIKLAPASSCACMDLTHLLLIWTMHWSYICQNRNPYDHVNYDQVRRPPVLDLILVSGHLLSWILASLLSWIVNSLRAFWVGLQPLVASWLDLGFWILASLLSWLIVNSIWASLWLSGRCGKLQEFSLQVR